ncbi:MAG: hypothetical protein JSV63_03295 [Candidatus Aenigmatarchaeota archaeon]|nr:MAG: hypothetical protein JSV63_03295 [Candidatus Aenigmarchaeota archaeon]
MRKHVWIFIAFFMVALLPPLSSGQLNDPENLTYVKAEIIQSGHLRLNSESSFATAEDLSIRLYVPQNDSRQNTMLTKVIGPERYFFSEDGYGNTQIVIVWENPPLDIDVDYLIETLVHVEARSSGVSKNFPVTSVIEPSQEIIETAYIFGGVGKSLENILLLSKWVNENVEYDLSCEREAFPAKWVYEHGIGTCDEFSNLLLSMLRTLDYQAWYVAGYAYLGGKQEGATAFGSHAWIEARLDGQTYGMDPTWAEAPLDATHITFARLPDSNFTEQTAVKSRDVSLRWEKEETVVQLLEYREKPRIETTLRAVPESVGGDKNVMILAEMEADGCVATKMRIASCIDKNGNNMIGIEKESSAIAFCDNTKFYWFGEVPRVGHGIKYICPVNVGAGGAINKVKITIMPDSEKDVFISTATQKILVPGQDMDLGVSVMNSGYSSADLRVFAILEGDIKERSMSLLGRESKELSFSFTAPKIPGNYQLHVFSDSGDLQTETIQVISDRDLKISEIAIPKSLVAGSTGTINVTVINSGEPSSVTVKLQAGGHSETKTVSIDKDGSSVVSFDFEAVSDGSINVIVSVLDEDGSYQDSWTGNVVVLANPSLKENVSSMIEDLIMAIVDFFRSLFGG